MVAVERPQISDETAQQAVDLAADLLRRARAKQTSSEYAQGAAVS